MSGGGGSYLVIEAGTAPMPEVRKEEAHAQPEEADGSSAPQPSAGSAAPAAQKPDPPSVMETASDRPKPVQVFVAHGRSLKPLDQLKKILNEWQVPFVVAVDEPNAGRPIPEKIADLMKECSAGIFIFSADEEFTDSSGTQIFRPSQNVIYELGAAGLLYGRKIVVFRESGVSFPSDFSDLGFIDFERDALDAKAMDLLRELIALKAVKLVSSSAE
jgi:predicted nucleotide-binding protein